MIWAGDVYLGTGLISRLHPILDFVLYGIDLIELVSLAAIISTVYAHGFHGNTFKKSAKE